MKKARFFAPFEPTLTEPTSRVLSTGVALLLCAVGLALIVAPVILHDRIPGDIGDGRFNRYVLEHFHLWLTGRTPYFWTAPFYFPFPLTVAFSDNHLGTGLVYSLLRSMGLDPENAFCGWYLVAYIVNYAAALFALRRLGCGGIASGAGAFLFAFGLPMTAQEGHAQLAYRFGVPLALLALVEFDRRPRLLSLVQLAFWATWQFYCSIYLGVFLLFVLMSTMLSMIVSGRGSILKKLSSRADRLWRMWKDAIGIERALASAAIAISTGALIALAVPYLEVKHIYNFRRDWGEIAPMLPRPLSYFYSANSWVWSVSWAGFDRLPMKHEHSMFFGIAPFIAVGMYLACQRSNDEAKVALFRVTWLSLLIAVLVTISIGDYSAYRLLVALPGVNAVRAVSRICVVLLFPVAVLTALAIDRLLDSARPVRHSLLLSTAIVLVMVIECAAIGHQSSSKIEWRTRIDSLIVQLPSSLPSDPIIFVAPTAEPQIVREIDGMMLAQMRGWKTLNGYSGNAPPGHVFSGNCSDAAQNLAAGALFSGSISDAALRLLSENIVVIGGVGCFR